MKLRVVCFAGANVVQRAPDTFDKGTLSFALYSVLKNPSASVPVI
jgi:hypothetical protein